MKRILAIFFQVFLFSLCLQAQNVTVKAVNQPASTVFRNLMEQTGKNFVYSSDLLRDMKVSINVTNQPLKKVLDEIFKNTDIKYSFKGKNVILKREKKKEKKPKKSDVKAIKKVTIPDTVIPTILREVVVFPENGSSNVETLEMGFKRLTSEEIRKTPTLFGETDIIRTLHTRAGVTEGMEIMAGMYVDGGNPDENLYMLDNIPLYQVNHFGGLFSAFNTDIISSANFYKTGIPAKLDGRLSSFMDVKLKSGIPDGHHGSARLGLTSGAFNITGPIGNKTSYLFGIRRSWYDVLTIPIMAIINSKSKSQKTKFNYYFTDLNAKLYHCFSSKLSGYMSMYYGNDHIVTGSKEELEYMEIKWYNNVKAQMLWGNLIVQAGLDYKITPNLSSEFTAAFTNYFSNIKVYSDDWEIVSENLVENKSEIKNHNNIRDLIFKGDFTWIPRNNIRTLFGFSYTLHSFKPNSFSKKYIFEDHFTLFRDSTQRIPGGEANAYIDLDWKLSDKIRLDLGAHGSLFHIEGKTHMGISPRLSLNYRPNENFAVKTAYSHTVQYVHQLSRSYLSLPTDQWIPITGNFKPQTADKLAMGGYWKSDNGMFAISVEGYYKKMQNLIDFKDEYYLLPALEMWNGQITSGSGRAKGIEVTFEKKAGKVTGYIGYTLAWSDRLFKEKNGGKRFPSRFDNRHTINILVNWEINDNVSLNASWVGHSGNRFTLLSQSFETPDFDNYYSSFDWGTPLKTDLNSYSLPFYHRLDLACNIKDKNGFWTISLYNAYCHLNTVAIVRESKDDNYSYETYPETYGTIPVFKKLKLFPLIPSISYTWEF